LPDEVTFEAGAFGTLGAIALQGVRLAEPTLGESVVVVGLGLLGQITVQLLKANGCRVFGVDLDPTKVALALELGADAAALSGEGVKRAVLDWSRGRGADAVLITAATPSNQPVEFAGEVSRLKGRVVAVGMVGLDVPRNLYFKRELSLMVSMSYGPGRYDPEYEERGHDYPFAYVRWTENRNIEAFLDLVAAGRVNVERLITHRFQIEEGERAYQLIGGETKEPYLGIVLQYDTERELESRVENKSRAARTMSASPVRAETVRAGLIGAGLYAQSVLLPHYKESGVEFRAVMTATGVTARDLAEKYGFNYCASSADEILDDADVNLVVVATRHDLHAELARRALIRGKHVFVEKPLALNEEELAGVVEAAENSAGRLMVGFNRRFSPLARSAQTFFSDRRAPLSILCRVNAGRIPKSHWLQDPREGGGRIIGEVCHFVDLMHFLTGSLVTRVYAEAVTSRNQEMVDEDNIFVTLKFADGSNGSIAYIAEGDKALAKERVEIFGEGKSFVLDDFRSATRYSNGRSELIKPRPQDKGQAAETRAVCAVVLGGGPAPIALEDLAATTRATFRIRESLRTGEPMSV
ncbi:MAG TPA: bi-domain-containing oxidoreductase, partial [Pyrinomonadaceae bacterium]|nr:bi-domain-containing oxidoreductase [Pyrinomonadaceae bacterium]